ncbi:SDR family oxidoreductase [Vibrio caribbeanicus]|uniref:Oxidoreductase n=1 Tax=Vibrio caribbeanicus ATCC BAA-2122 TaxID=796620 RepID=E3BQL6_9VIBR|nr:SDR family oxidoreductase [Vibrio caribbeanicus]EFP94690.1 oxidoreductase [Vibrio caribbeanicus ATCC BAA-2122]
MNDKIIVITGANSGMGLETTKLLSSKGAKIFAGYRGERGREILEDLNDTNIIPIYLDVTCSSSVFEAFRQIFELEKKIDVLINNAGYGYVSANEFADDTSIYDQFDVNVFGVFRTCREVVPYMRKHQTGQIINISSFLGKMGLPLLSHYSASKYAVEGLSNSLRYELAPFNIAVNTIAPGLFRTGFVNHGLHANELTSERTSPYAKTADALLPTIVERINQGIDPILVAEAVYESITDRSCQRVMVGNEGAFFESMKYEVGENHFENSVVDALGLPKTNYPSK